MKKNTKARIAYLLFITFLTWLPIIVGVIYSFNSGRSAGTWSGFSLKWYAKLFRDRSMISAFSNSILLGVSSSLLAAVISVPAAISFRNRSSTVVNLTRSALMIPILVPDIILGMVFLAFFRLLDLPFGMLTLIIAHTSFSIPYIYTQVSARLASMDDNLIAASRVLGAGPVRTFFEITLPYISPALLSGMILSFAMSFDDVIISIFVTGVNVNTLPIKVYTQVKTGMTPEVNALCTVMLAVALIGISLSALIKRRYSK
ncbi:MAG: ABC transporter permease [Eubacteriales bacterium]|nr:ABC transporter permease [Eubacteriales bacterium]